jgi:TM2 domain-containing membrane protein YozV
MCFIILIVVPQSLRILAGAFLFPLSKTQIVPENGTCAAVSTYSCRGAAFLLESRARMDQREGMMKNPGTAAVLSFFIPGVGQIYNGTFWRAIFWLIITPGLWIGSGGTLGWICHIISAYTAYSYAKRRLESQLQHT